MMRLPYMLLAMPLMLLLAVTSVQADDWDSLFDDDLFDSEVSVTDEAADVDHALMLLTQESIDIGGRVQFDLNYSAPLEDTVFEPEFRAALNGQVYLDARPTVDARFLARGNFSLDAADDAELSLKLAELFADWNYDNSVYFRVGKQNVSWGVGYFFSPADVISVGRLDPEDPEATREGPVALRIHVPQRRQDYHLFALFDGADSLDQVALAPRATFVVGRSEIGVGGFYRVDRVPRGMLTLSTSIASIDLFCEAVVSRGSDRTFVETDDQGNLAAVSREDWIVQATAGLQFSRPDPDGLFSVGMAAQYYYNGEGYSDRSVLYDPRLPLLLLNEEIKVSDLLPYTSLHYGAAAVNWSEMLNTKFSTSAFWLGNLSDGSGQITTSLSHRGWAGWKPSVGVSWFYGDDTTELGPGVTTATASLSYSLSF